ncbi:hypothetical protein DL93DRAFT_2059162 [Clavulina sp. PMI_390]|nr:hypothetical protein DL93DRAFT_2059162 [Clavulina sp. PMI_390]
MPVTIQCPSIKPEVLNLKHHQVPKTTAGLFETSVSREIKKKKEDRRWQASGNRGREARIPLGNQETCLRVHVSDEPNEKVQVIKATNGIVHSLTIAYNNHCHLVLRPDDVWHALLSQFSLYVQANAEALRKQFVAHEGKKELEVVGSGGFATADIGALAQEMGRLLEENVRDPDLRTWLMPEFSTTTNEDTTIASIIMMATLQKYFDYKMSFLCGIPSITLLGTSADWAALRAKVDKFAEFGTEPEKWVKLLQPVCDALLGCFDERNLEQSRDFWSRVCHYQAFGSGSRYLCGWATVFTVWNKDGKWQGDHRIDKSWIFGPGPSAALWDWPMLDPDDIAPACAEVPVLVDDNGVEHNTLMLAGLPGCRLTENDEGESIISPLSGWAMFEVLMDPKS